MTILKEWMNAQWQAPGVKYANHGTAWLGDGVHNIRARAGAARNYKSKEQKAYEARFAIYNKKLVPIILTEATSELRDMELPIIDKYGRPEGWEVKNLPEYRWPKQTKSEPIAIIPRKRVPKAKLDQAQAILAKVPPDELAAFLARFGLSMSLAVSIASLDNLEQVARQFLRATL